MNKTGSQSKTKMRKSFIKPYEHAWNHNIFDYRDKHYMPIPDNYDKIFKEPYRTQIKLIRCKNLLQHHRFPKHSDVSYENIARHH